MACDDLHGSSASASHSMPLSIPFSMPSFGDAEYTLDAIADGSAGATSEGGTSAEYTSDAIVDGSANGPSDVTSVGGPADVISAGGPSAGGISEGATSEGAAWFEDCLLTADDAQRMMDALQEVPKFQEESHNTICVKNMKERKGKKKKNVKKNGATSSTKDEPSTTCGGQEKKATKKKKAATQHVDDASGVTDTISSTKGEQKKKKATKKKKSATQHVDVTHSLTTTTTTSSTKGEQKKKKKAKKKKAAHVDEATGGTSATSSTKKAKKDAADNVYPPVVHGIFEATTMGIDKDRWVKKLYVTDDKNPVMQKVGSVPVVYSKVLLPPGVTKLSMSHFYTQEQIAFRKKFASSCYSKARKLALQLGAPDIVAIRAAQLVHRETVLRYDMDHIVLADVLKYTLIECEAEDEAEDAW
jgi:hypothetical protein